MGNVVEIDGVIKRFGRGGAQVEALRRARTRLGEAGASVRVARIAEDMLGPDCA